jgi:hypothetical protein
MAETVTFRPDDLDRKIMARIRKFLTETVGEPSETQVIRFGLRAAARELDAKKK